MNAGLTDDAADEPALPTVHVPLPPVRSRPTLLWASLLAVFLLAIWWQVTIWQANHLRAEGRSRAASQLVPYGHGLVTALNRRFALLDGMRSAVRTQIRAGKGLQEEELDSFASGLSAGVKGIKRVTVSPGGTNRFVYPRAGNEALLGQPIVPDDPAVRARLEQAMRSGRMIVHPPERLPPGGITIRIQHAVEKDGRLWGVVTADFELQPILSAAGIDRPGGGLLFALRAEPGGVVYGAPTVFESAPVTWHIHLSSEYWELGAVPAAGWNAAMRDALFFVHWVGLFVVVLLSSVAYLVVGRQNYLNRLVGQRTAELRLELAERRRAETRLSRVNRALKTVSECNIALVRANDEQALLDRICELLVKTAGYGFVWVGLAETDGAKSVTPAARAGGDADYVEHPGVTWDESALGLGPTGTAIRTAAPVLCRDIGSDPRFAPWREAAARRGFTACFSVPLRTDGQTVGALTIYAADPDAFDEEEVELLGELAEDLAYGISALRTRGRREQLESRLAQAHKLETLGKLAGGVAHDFNNLLTVINGYSDLLRTMIAEGDPRRKALDAIREAGEKGAGLTQQLLAFGRKQPLQVRRMDLSVTIAEMEGMLQRLIGTGVQLVVARAAEPCAVEADPAQMQQVVMNLVLNARDAMPSGGRLRIETARGELDDATAATRPGAKPGPYVELAVSDTGVGMDAETLSHIFEPFFTTKAKGRGTGLGLPTVYGIVAQSGGHITVESRPDRGSTFRIFLPRAPAPAPAATPMHG